MEGEGNRGKGKREGEGYMGEVHTEREGRGTYRVQERCEDSLRASLWNGAPSNGHGDKHP